MRGETKSRVAMSFGQSLADKSYDVEFGGSERRPTVGGSFAFATAALYVGDRLVNIQCGTLGACGVKVLLAQSITQHRHRGFVAGLVDLEADVAGALPGGLCRAEKPRSLAMAARFAGQLGETFEDAGTPRYAPAPLTQASASWRSRSACSGSLRYRHASARLQRVRPVPAACCRGRNNLRSGSVNSACDQSTEARSVCWRRTRTRGARTAGEQAEPVVKTGDDVGRRHRTHPCRRELDCHGHAVKAAADLRHRGDVLVIANAEIGPGPAGAVGEQLDRFVGQRQRRHPPVTSPGTPISSRLVASSVNPGQVPSRESTSAALASNRCSQLSNTISMWRSPMKRTSVSSVERPGWSGSPRARATATGTMSGSVIGASSTCHTPSRNLSAIWAATCTASRVLPGRPNSQTRQAAVRSANRSSFAHSTAPYAGRAARSGRQEMRMSGCRTANSAEPMSCPTNARVRLGGKSLGSESQIRFQLLHAKKGVIK